MGYFYILKFLKSVFGIFYDSTCKYVCITLIFYLFIFRFRFPESFFGVFTCLSLCVWLNRIAPKILSSHLDNMYVTDRSCKVHPSSPSRVYTGSEGRTPHTRLMLRLCLSLHSFLFHIHNIRKPFAAKVGIYRLNTQTLLENW